MKGYGSKMYDGDKRYLYRSQFYSQTVPEILYLLKKFSHQSLNTNPE